MGAFLGISLWIALATVVPGLVTIAVLYGALLIIHPTFAMQLIASFESQNDWFLAGVTITVMVLTQALGILLEGIRVKRRWLGPSVREIDLPDGIDPYGETQLKLSPYFEYEGLYILLAELTEHEDSQGHLKRSLAQFFLTNNTLVSFLTAIIFSAVLLILEPANQIIIRSGLYIILMVFCLTISYKVALIRFEVMAKSLWATRRRRFFGQGSPS